MHHHRAHFPRPPPHPPPSQPQPPLTYPPYPHLYPQPPLQPHPYFSPPPFEHQHFQHPPPLIPRPPSTPPPALLHHTPHRVIPLNDPILPSDSRSASLVRFDPSYPWTVARVKQRLSQLKTDLAILKTSNDQIPSSEVAEAQVLINSACDGGVHLNF